MVNGEKKQKVSVILPTYNEENALINVIRDIKAVMDVSGYPYEILVVDDCSSDNSALLAQQEGVRLIKRKTKGGSGAARKTGIRASYGDIVVMLDADGSYVPSDIPRLLEHIPEYDQVIGWRKVEQGGLKMLRFPVKWLICRFASYLARTDIPDLNSGIRALKKNFAEQFLWAVPDGFSCVSSLTLMFLCNDLSVKWVPVEYRRRIGLSKFHPVKDTFYYIVTVIKIITYCDPLRFFIPLGFILFFAGSAKAVNDIFLKILPSSLYIDVTLLISSVVIFAIGLLSNLIIVSRKR